ncbi:hypothetical protein Tco_0478713, partial [Tanacetum coccineum]
RYGVFVPALTKDHEGNKIQYAESRRKQYAVFKLYGNRIFWKISNVVPTPRNPQYAVSMTLDTPSVEIEFPAIVFNYSLTLDETLSCEPTVSSLNDEIDFRISFDESDDEDYMILSSSSQDMAPLPPRDQRHLWLRYQVVGYTEEIVHDFEKRLETIFSRQVNQELEIEMGLSFRYGGTLCFQLGGARRSMTWRHFILALGLHTAKEIAEDEFGAYWLGSGRLIPDKGGLSDYWVKISFGMDFLRGASLYTYIRDLVQRLCHKLISYSISGRGGHLKMHVEGRKSGTRLSGGHFIRHLAHHFGLVSDDGLRGLSVVAPPGLERQRVVIAGAPEATKDALVVDEGAQADPAPIQAPQPPPPPPAVGRTIPRRLGRLEEEM